jgi:hypothetical protein
MAYTLQPAPPPPPLINPPAGLKFRQYKSTAAFNFSLSARSLIYIFPKKRVMPTHIWACYASCCWFRTQNVLIMAQMCLGSNDMCPGFTRQHLVRHRADIQKKCSILLYCLHLRPATDLISRLYTVGNSVLQFPDVASVTSIPRQIYNKCCNIFTPLLHLSY